MRRLMVAAGAAAILAASSLGAFAAQTSGIVKNVDEHANSVTLEDGSTFLLPATFDIDTLVIGKNVTITYDADANGQMVASEVVPRT